MANILKVKITLIVISVSILTLIPLLESNFNAPITIKKWQELNWDDFLGIPKPFAKWGAVISSNVFLEFDTTSSLFLAYAGQNNQRSWVKRRSKDSDYLLNHEQYHFNISELHARMMNNYLQNNLDKEEKDHLSKLSLIRAELYAMQSKYDAETGHGLNISVQRRWEYIIDSLLLVYSTDSGLLTDDVSGAQLFFPAKPDIQYGENQDGLPYRMYQLEKYDMLFLMAAISCPLTDGSILKENLYEYNKNKSNEILFIQVDTSRHEFGVSVEAVDSLKENAIHQLWIYHYNTIFHLRVQYPTDDIDIKGYDDNSKSFLGSFQIKTDSDE
jgi:hypothetical protein